MHSNCTLQCLLVLIQKNHSKSKLKLKPISLKLALISLKLENRTNQPKISHNQLKTRTNQSKSNPNQPKTRSKNLNQTLHNTVLLYISLMQLQIKTYNLFYCKLARKNALPFIYKAFSSYMENQTSTPIKKSLSLYFRDNIISLYGEDILFIYSNA